MKAIVFLLTLLLASESLRGQCSLGCLSCKKTSPITFACSVCDLHNKYAMNEDMKCVESQIENCEVPSADHTTALCLSCKSGFVLDQTQKKCVEVSEFHKVDNCMDYLAINHCKTCESDFYIKDGLCSAVGDSKIADCQSYNTDLSQCLSCNSGKFLKDNACEAITTIENCSLYSETICDECTSGYLHEMNYYSSAQMTAKLAHEIILNNKVNDQKVMPPLPTVCIKQDIPFCDTYVNFSFCGSCITGYYLDAQRNCSENPDNEIPNCKIYSDHETCVECEMEYFLASNECESRTMVDNCVKYEVNSGICLECSALYFLNSGGNTCEERVLSKHIEFCEERDMNLDVCKKCRDRFLLTSDNLGCKFHVENCATYLGTSNFNTSDLLCSVCNDGFYPMPDKKSCAAQDIVNCVTYISNSNECEKCNHGMYYHNTDKLCKAYTALNCATTAEAEDKCLTCQPGHYLTNPHCLKYSISNCLTPDPNADTCTTCFDNHFKKDGNCFAYNIVGCLDFKPDDNLCIKCNSGFYKSGELCLKNNLMNCVVASETTNECLECEDNYFLDGSFCDKIHVPNCKETSSDSKTCMAGQCEDGYYLDSGHCLKITQPNCAEINTTDGTCTTCESGYVSSGALKPCVPQYKPFCLEYTANTNNCTKCEEGYFLDSSSCYPQNRPGCKAFATTTSNNCDECREGFYLDSNNCYPYNIQNCLEAEPAKDECKSDKCMEGYFLHPITKSCYLPDLPNCAVPDTTDLNKCGTCMDGFFLHGTTSLCEPMHLEKNCLWALEKSGATPTSTAPLNKCQLCALGYFPNSDGLCELVDLDTSTTHCIKNIYNTEFCEVCENLYSKADSTMTCTALTKTDCVLSGGVDDYCLVCEKEKKSDGSGGCEDFSGTDYLTDDLCFGNASTNDYECSRCNDGYTQYEIPDDSELIFVEHCVNFTSNACDQCAEGYKYDSGTTSCQVASGNHICLKKTAAGVGEELTAATNCEKCEHSGYFLSSTTCTARTVEVDNCGTYDDTDICLSCEKGFYPDIALYNYSFCVENKGGLVADTAITAISNCEVINNTTNTNCAICDQTTETKSDGTCGAITTPFTFFFDDALGIFNTKDLGATPVGDASVLGRATTKVNYMKCDAGFVASLGSYNGGTATNIYTPALTGIAERNFYDKLTESLSMLGGSRVQIDSCVDVSTIIDPWIKESGLTADTDLIQIKSGIENCLWGLADANNEFFCHACKAGYNPILISQQSNHDNSAAYTNPQTSLACLEKTEEFVKKYKGFSPDYGVPFTGIFYTEYMNFDSCANGDILIASMKIAASDAYATWSALPGTLQHPALKCVPFVSQDVLVPNCHVYAADPAVDPTIAGSSADVKCIACKPGYKATFFTAPSDLIQTCTLIENCDVSDPSKNTYLSTCETCNPGYVWEYDGTTNHVFQKEKCVKLTISGGLENEHCQAGTSSACYICKSGYELDNRGTCVTIYEGQNGCTSFGLPRSFLNDSTTMGTVAPATNWNSTAKSWVNYSLLNHFFNTGKTTHAFGCQTCPTNISAITDTTGNLTGCYQYTSVENFVPTVANCKEILNSDAAKCGVCEDGYAVNDGNTACLEAVGTLENCVTAASTATNCATCKEGYFLGNTSCIDTGNCELWSALGSSSYKCDVCKRGYIPDMNDSTQRTCLEAPSDDPCTRWTFALGCIECANNRTPITIIDESNNIFAKCTTKKSTKLDGTTNHTTFGSPFVIKYESNVYKNKTLWAALPGGFIDLKSDLTAPQLKHVCIPNFEIENCDLIGPDNKCMKCQSGYTPAGPFVCQKGTITGCVTYNNYKSCVECGAGFFLSSTYTCTERTNKNCLTFNPSKDECLRCQGGEYLNASFACSAHASVNCLNYFANTDTCFKCKPGYFWKSPSPPSVKGVCTLVNNPGCDLVLENSGNCLRCSEGYYIDNTDGICKRYTFEGCKRYLQNSDQCVECEADFFMTYTAHAASVTDVRLNHYKCSKRKTQNCLVANPYADECYSCQPGMYLDSNKCKWYSAQNCSLYHVSMDQCVDCLDGFFRNANQQCVPNSDPNCKIMGKYNSRCLLCNEGTYFFYDTGDVNNPENGKCKLNTQSCKTFNPNSNECLSCEDGLWNDNGVCKRYKAINCRVYAINVDQCASCLDNHFLDSTNGSCYASGDPNCEILEIYEDSCLRCYSGYFINTTKNCEPYTIQNCRYRNPLKNACLVCNDGFFLNDSMDCQMNSQKNCLGYINNMNECASCEPGHFFSDGICSLYTIENCREFDSHADNCLVCKDNHYKWKNDCKEYTAEHCKTFNPLLDHCASCEEDRYLQLGKCLEYTLEDCKKKHPEADMCEECEEGEYFRNGYGKCQEVTEVEDCMTYDKYFDKCIACEDTHYLMDGKCMANPSGVYQCKTYATEELCAVCNAPYYLKENKCYHTTVIIPNCSYYSFDGNCGKCDGNAFLISNACVAVTESSCTEYTSPENCSKCAVNEVLDTSGSTVVCKASGITDCFEAEYSTEPITPPVTDPPTPASTITNLCKKCMPGFFLKDNACTATTTVTECSEYETEELCSKCKPNFILSKDKKSCTAIGTIAGANCSTARNTASPECIVCKDGFFFNSEGVCTECQVTGCAICDVINLRKCKLCKSGYQMTELFYCETISTIEGDQPKINRMEDDRTEDSNSIQHLSSQILIAVMALFFGWNKN